MKQIRYILLIVLCFESCNVLSQTNILLTDSISNISVLNSYDNYKKVNTKNYKVFKHLDQNIEYSWLFDTLMNPIENHFRINNSYIHSSFYKGKLNRHKIYINNYYYLTFDFNESGELIAFEEYKDKIRKSFDFFDNGDLAGFCVCNEQKKKPCLIVNYYKDGKIELTDHILSLEAFDSTEIAGIPEQNKLEGYYWVGPLRSFDKDRRVYDEGYATNSRIFKHKRYDNNTVEVTTYDKNGSILKSKKKKLWLKGMFIRKAPRKYSQNRMVKKFKELYPHQ